MSTYAADKAKNLAVQHLDNATLILYSDAGHAFLFQHAKAPR
ncbi:hypothetical protein ACTWPT_46640 [Nonomuraea sp. 3N208]